jgi:hypoxanthine phosphoribosyltransferase
MKEFISWEQYDNYINKIFDWVDQLQRYQGLNIGAVYGLPRGGLPIAVSLSHKLNLPLLMSYDDRKVVTDQQILIVDDIADTGNTLNHFRNEERNVIVTLHFHEQSIVRPDFYCEEKGDKWIVYPWEREDSETIQDYLNKV